MKTQYLNTWLTVIEQMNNDNTYKLAWGRAIIECVVFDKYSLADKKVVIEFDEISKCMIKYYWNQLFFFNLKQSPYKDKIPLICKYTNILIEEYKKLSKCNFPVWFDEGIEIINKNNSNLFNNIIKKVSNTLHQNVCWRFKNIPTGVADLYEYSKELGSRIFIKYDDMLCLKEYAVIISKLLNYKWAQLLENFNFAPKIVSKINGISNAKLKRNNLSKYKEELLKQFKEGKIIDFYTGKELSYDDISIDHVIPWSYMYSDDIWNLVITSKSYNSSKSNSIPTHETIKKLKERNKELLAVLNGKYKDDIILAINNGYIDKFYYECRL